MKHVILFLNYHESRLENPVYRFFATESLTHRRAALIFLNHSFEGREFLHEVNELLGKNPDEDITFHITKPLVEEDDCQEVINAARRIRQLFTLDGCHAYPIYTYVLTKPLPDCTPAQSKALLRNLGAMNNAVMDFKDDSFIRTIFIFHDESYMQLARYLYAVTRIEKLPYEPTKYEEKPQGDTALFSPIFGAFNAIGTAYPEAETRAYLHQYYLLSVLRRYLPEVNPTPMETVNTEAQQILSFIPLAKSRICLQEDSFLDLGDDNNAHWTPTEDYWDQEIKMPADEIKEIPRDDWFSKIQKRVELLYQGKFRGMGTDYFFSLQMKKTDAYASALLEIIRGELNQAVASHPYTPETLKNIVRSITNVLQQQVLTFQHERDTTAGKIPMLKRHVREIENRWSERGFFSRWGGKDMRTLNLYYETLRDYNIQRTWILGYDFAIKLLNELIPQVSSLVDPFETLRVRFSDALATIQQTLENTNPFANYDIFSSEDTQQAAKAIDADADHMLATYQRILLPVYRHIAGGNNDDTLLTTVRGLLTQEVDSYLNQRMEEGYLPKVVGRSIVERISQVYRLQGGFPAWVAESRKKAPITLALKPTRTDAQQITEKWLLVSPHVGDYLDVPVHEIEETSQLHLLHILRGVRLCDLDSFAGQRLFVEPNLF